MVGGGGLFLRGCIVLSGVNSLKICVLGGVWDSFRVVFAFLSGRK